MYVWENAKQGGRTHYFNRFEIPQNKTHICSAQSRQMVSDESAVTIILAAFNLRSQAVDNAQPIDS